MAVTVASLLLGVPLAWLTVRSDLPARRFFAVATALPLVIPTYVGAYAILATFAPGGLVESWLRIRPPSPYGFPGAFAALTLFTYPYVLLTCQAALRGIDPRSRRRRDRSAVGRWRPSCGSRCRSCGPPQQPVACW